MQQDGNDTARYMHAPNITLTGSSLHVRVTDDSTGWSAIGALQLQMPPPANEIYIDTAGTTPAGWNGVNFGSIVTVNDLIRANGGITEVSIAINERMNAGVNSNGSGSPSGDAAEFAPAGTSQRYRHTGTWGGDADLTQCVAVVSGLTATNTYDFTFYASRMGATDNRETRYTVIGSNTGFADLNAAGNSRGVALVTNILPTSNGEVTLRIAAGPNNNNSPTSFYYLLAMKIEWRRQASGTVFLVR